MLPSGLSWATFASLVLGVSCANDFVSDNTSTRSLPSQFGAGTTKTIYWTNPTGYIVGIYVTGNGQSDDSADYNWVLDPNCPEESDSICTAHDNTGHASFYVNETAIPLGSGYRLRLLWTNSKTYEDVDDDTEEVESSEFSVVPAESLPDLPSDTGHGLGPAEQAGISIAVIVVVIFLLLVIWFRWRRTKKRRERRERLMRGASQDKEQGGWYERWTAGKPTRDTEETWTASDQPAKPSPTVSSSAVAAAAAAAGAGAVAGAVGVRKVSNTSSDGAQQPHPYLDDKAEMPAGADGANRHEIDSLGTSAARNKVELDGTSAPQGGLAIAELPAEPVSGHTSSRTVSSATTFEYNPNPSYALQPPASPRPDAEMVSPVSEGVGTYNSLAGSVSPVTPIARKPVGGMVSTIPEQEQQEQQQQQNGVTAGQDMLTPDAADGAPKRGKSEILRTEKSRIWKMLGGGSTKGKLNPSGGANV
ncbi:hypothetical protein KVR01_005062 [Diaporthe batatas]|uniref:uncharacterized protein n=1 Tax=Diaporthe batatas TaxID=748121 RepID=UPI001D03BD43|nr:uncharacterized protein KVR01_005062 [Diaporthe batatas]KAG8164787.1 hypothetical protein KVR01_005062 [Diaporthe batatas]